MKMKSLSVVGLVACLLIGCASLQSNAGKLLASTAQTVDAAMTAWGAHVSRDHVPAAQQAPVKDAYEKYQTSMSSAVLAYAALVNNNDQSAWTQASAALTASSTGLLQLLQSFAPATGGAP